MGILANWKIYLVFAATIVIFYFMYMDKVKENATLQSANKILTQNLEIQKKVTELKDSIIKSQERLLINNREQLRLKQLELDSIELKLEERKDSGDDAHPYLKELFKELGKTK